MNSIRNITLILGLILHGCSGDFSDTSEQGESPFSQDEIPGNLDLVSSKAALHVSGPNEIEKDGYVDINVSVASLPNDSEVYMIVSKYDRKEMRVSPSSSILYPSLGMARLNIRIEEQDITYDHAVTIEVALSDGTRMSHVHNISLVD